MALHRSDIVATGTLVAVTLAGLVVYGDLPAEMAIHFGAGGQPDSFVAKPVGVVLAPAIGVAAVAFSRFSIERDRSSDPVIGTVSIYFVAGIVAYVQGLLLAYNLGYRFSIWLSLAPVFVAAGVLVVWSFRRDGRF